jgi:hypothetical protein
MYVGLQHVGDTHPVLGGDRQHPVDVALGVDHHRHLPVVREVAAVTEA